MTLELFIYGIALFVFAALLLMAACCAYLAGQLKCLEIKPEAEAREVAPKDEKAQKMTEKSRKLKAEIDEEEEDMDRAVKEFIERGGLPE